MTSPHSPFRLSAALLLGNEGIRSLPLQADWSTDPSQLPLLCEWMEFDRVRLRLEGFDQGGSLQVEGVEGPIPLGGERVFPDPAERETDAYPWYPGDYEWRVTVGEKTWYGLFRVKPRHLDADQLAQLRQDLERVVAGLTLDVSASRGYQSPRSGGQRAEGTAVRLRQFTLLREAVQEVATAMAQIEREPQRRLGRTYQVVPWHRSQRLDGRSFRWLSQGTWLRDPKALPAAGDSRLPQVVLAPTGEPSYDTYENRVVAFILDSLRGRARGLGQAVALEMATVQNEMAQARRQGWETRQWAGQESGYRQLLSLVEEVEDRLVRLRHRPFLAAVGQLGGLPNPTTTLLKDSRYRTLYRWYRQIEDALVPIDMGDAFQVRTKRTSTLYEYWALFRVLELFGEIGFHLSDGGLGLTLRAANQRRLVPVIEPATTFWLKNDAGQRLRVVYDQELPTTQEEALGRGTDLYIANPRNRPDIRVDLMQGEEPVRCLVLDAKYRRAQAIWNQTYPDVIYQLLSYAGNLYRTEQPMRPLTEVAIALYPGAVGDPDWQTREAGAIALARLVPHRPTPELTAAFRRFVGDISGL